MRSLIFVILWSSWVGTATAACENGNTNVRLACLDRTNEELRATIVDLKGQLQLLQAGVADISSGEVTSEGTISTQPESNGGGELSSCPAGSVISAVQIHRHSNGLAALRVRCNSIGVN